MGENSQEEINDGIAGSNYGWPATEGPTSNPNFRSPLFAYGHGAGPTTGCAIAGAAFYRSATALFPADFIGDYFFADLCSGWIRRFDPASGVVTDFASGFSAPVDLQVGADGGLYVLSRGGSRPRHSLRGHLGRKKARAHREIGHLGPGCPVPSPERRRGNSR